LPTEAFGRFFAEYAATKAAKSDRQDVALGAVAAISRGVGGQIGAI
jgi:hypothetical protein